MKLQIFRGGLASFSHSLLPTAGHQFVSQLIRRYSCVALRGLVFFSFTHHMKPPFLP